MLGDEDTGPLADDEAQDGASGVGVPNGVGLVDLGSAGRRKKLLC